MRNIRLGSLLGIPILVNPTWFIMFGFTTWFLATEFYPETLRDAGRATHYAMAAVSAVAFFASIVLHELAHSVVARRHKIPVRSITLFLFGGVAQITREAARPLHELFMAAVGPLTSLALGGVFLGAWFAIGAEQSRPIDYVLLWLSLMNFVLGVFNLLPAFPMDGGRMFRSLLWLITRNYNRATSIAAWTGRGFAWTMIGLGMLGVMGFNVLIARDWGSGAWLIFIALFLENAARQSLVQNRLVQELQRFSAGDLMNADPPVIDGERTVGSAARGVLELNPRVCYFVEEAGKLAGILSAHQIMAVPESSWDSTTAAEAMLPSARLRATPRQRLVSDVLLEMETWDLFHMPVVEEGRVIGVIARERILAVLRQANLIAPARA